MGSIVRFSRYPYKYASGREGDAPAAGFSTGKAATAIYVLEGGGARRAAHTAQADGCRMPLPEVAALQATG